MTKYSIYNNLKNANYIHDNGFFVGNHPRPLKNEINFLNNVFKKIKIWTFY
jgi:CDP-6-deoxy-D-xylo-4-hexulose-3-dehydrase